MVDPREAGTARKRVRAKRRTVAVGTVGAALLVLEAVDPGTAQAVAGVVGRLFGL